MAVIPRSTYHGYRELAPLPPGGGMRPWWFRPIKPEIRLQYWQWDLLGPVPFWYEVYSGLAEDDYQSDFIEFPFTSRLIMATITDAPAYIIWTYDGVTELPERRFDLGFARLEAAVGFKVKNAEPGIPARYQIIAML